MFAFTVASQMSGAVTSAMIHLGDRLGLYRALAGAANPMTSAELAAATELDERWVREWACNQAAAKLVAVADDESGANANGDATGDGDGGERWYLTPEAIAVLVDPSSESYLVGMFHDFPDTMGLIDRLPDSFRSGLGYDYDAQGAEGAVALERGSFDAWMRVHLIDDVLPMLDGVTEKLQNGARAADIGCGAGGVVMVLGSTFPHSSIIGYDISLHALGRARQRAAEAGLSSVEFLDPRTSPIAGGEPFDTITTCDCLHDMTDPVGMMRTIHDALAPDGTWLLVDIKAHDTFAQNAERNPMAALMYGTSVLSCLSSALSEPGGAGLGTLGLSPHKAEAMARDAGFTRFRRLDVEHPVNAFYEIRR